MEWVTTTGRSLAEAKERALDQLGVAEDDAEFEILDEPRPGLFGRVRGEARVRARVRPTQPRPKMDRRDRKRAKRLDGDAASADGANDQVSGTEGVAPARSPRGGKQGGGAGRSGNGRRPSAAAAGADDVVTTELTSDITEDATPEAAATERDASAAGTTERPPSSGAKRRRRGGRGRGGARPRPADGDGDGAGAESGDDATEIETTRDHAGTEQQEVPVDAQQVGEEARAFVQALVDAFGLQGTATLQVDGDDLEVAVAGADLGLLVGPRGTTLQAVQELARVAAQRRHGDHDTRLRVDVGGYRVKRREALTRFALDQAAQVVAEGTARALEPMSSSDRKVIHDALSAHDGVVTRSEGDDPLRRVVIAPARD